MESIGYFSLSRMSKKDFFFLNACFSADIDFLVNLMEESISEIYKHSADLAPDETMLPSKILKNCHHMFIRGKHVPNIWFVMILTILMYNRKTASQWHIVYKYGR